MYNVNIFARYHFLEIISFAVFNSSDVNCAPQPQLYVYICVRIWSI